MLSSWKDNNLSCKLQLDNFVTTTSYSLKGIRLRLKLHEDTQRTFQKFQLIYCNLTLNSTICSMLM